MDLNQTSDQMEMFGYTAEGAQQEADKFVEEAGDLEKDISNAASFIVPFYDSGVNIVNVAQEYMKPEQERDYEYIKDQFREAGQSAAIEGGLLLMGGVGGKYGAKGIKALADKVKQYEIDPTAMSAFGAGAIRKKPFKKTRKAYKLFIQRDGKLYPLFVNAADEVPMGEFLEADLPKTMFTAPNGRNYVPSKGGKRSKGEKSRGTGVEVPIPDEKTRQLLIKEGFITEKKGRGGVGFGKILAVAARPGWHASQAPVATHIGVFRDMPVSKKEVNKLLEAGITPEAIVKYRGKFYVKRREDDLVFAEVEMADDVDYQSMLKSEGKTDINDRVPKGGSYRYEDGQADSDKWVVGGDMRVKRTLSREETKATQKELGVKDLPYRDEVESILGKKFNKGGLAGDIMYTGDEDYKVTSSYGEDEMQMNKGGAVDGQMQMAFMNEGGIADDGMDVDPVSGNEVPPGSLAEEVRDDIPAQLSEGEYVVPADVVRYYGVKFFEDLRDQAKMGLAEMEANGRIGGEPVPAGGPINDQELSPQEMQAIQEMMGMAEGGEVQNPYLQQQQLYSQPRPAPIDEKRNTTITNVNPVDNQMPMQSMASGGQVQGYQEGGAETTTTPSPAVNTFNPAQFGLGFSFMGQPQQTGQQTTETTATFLTLYGPEGQVRKFRLPLSQEDAAEVARLRALGYSETPPADTTTTTTGTPGTDTTITTDLTGATVTSGGDRKKTQVDSDPNAWMEKYDYTDMSKLGSQTSEMLTQDPKRGVIGLLDNARIAAEAAANIIIMKSNGASKEEVDKATSEYNQFIKDAKLEYFPKGIMNGDRLSKDIAANNIDVALFEDTTDPFGNRIFKDANDFNRFSQKIGPKGRGSKGLKASPRPVARPTRPADQTSSAFPTGRLPVDTQPTARPDRQAVLAQEDNKAKAARERRKKRDKKFFSSQSGKKSITSAEKKKLDARKKGATGYTGGRSEGGLMNKKGDK